MEAGRRVVRRHCEVGGAQQVLRATGRQRAAVGHGLLRLGDLAEHRAKEQLGGLANDRQHGARVGDARHAHDDVLALEVDLGARDAEAVHAVGEHRHDLLHVGVRRGGRGLVDHRQPAGKVEPQFGTPAE